MSAVLQDYARQKPFKLPFKFTILVPLDPQLSFLETWLESLLEQTHTSPTEVIFLDDAQGGKSRSNLIEILENYSQYLGTTPYTFQYFQQQQPVGKTENLNRGLALANGTWIYIFPHGDRLLPEAFYTLDQVIDEHPDVELITCRFYCINDQDEILEKSPPLTEQGLVNDAFLQQFLGTNPLPVVASLYHKNIFNQIGNFNPSLRAGADWEFLRRASKIPHVQWYYLPQHLVCHRSLDSAASTFSHQHPAGEFLWQMQQLSQHYYSEPEQKIAKRSQYLRLFTLADQWLEQEKIAEVCGLILDIVKFSDLGDRLWLDVLNQAHLSHKKELYNFVVQFSQKSYLKTLV